MADTAAYRIRFQGVLDEPWWQYLGTTWSIHVDDDSAPESTTIIGVLRDQAALIGLLGSLYDVGLPLLEVTCLETNARPPG